MNPGHSILSHIHLQPKHNDSAMLWCIIQWCIHCLTLSNCTLLLVLPMQSVVRTLPFQVTTPTMLLRLTIDVAFCLHIATSVAFQWSAENTQSNYDTAFVRTTPQCLIVKGRHYVAWISLVLILLYFWLSRQLFSCGTQLSCTFIVVPGGMIAHTFPRPVTSLFFSILSFLVLPFRLILDSFLCRILIRIDYS